MRIVYAGSPEIASIPLKGLLEDGRHKIVAVLTNPPSRKGRHGELVPTSVEQVARDFCAQNQVAAEQNQISSAQNQTGGLQNVDRASPVILTPEHLDSEIRSKIASLKPDILVCFAYGKIFGPKFMELFPLGGINLHPSLLPKYRGCAPVPATLLNMDKETGFTVQRIVQEMDAGNIIVQTRFNIEETDNSETILNRAANEGTGLFLEALRQIEDGTALQNEREQDSTQATYCRMLEKSDGKIDWNQSAAQIDAKIRAFYPWPGAFTHVNENVLKIHSASVFKGNEKAVLDSAMDSGIKIQAGRVLCFDKKCGFLVQTGNGILVLRFLQWQTKKVMNWKDFFNGNKNFVGCLCGA